MGIREDHCIELITVFLSSSNKPPASVLVCQSFEGTEMWGQ